MNSLRNKHRSFGSTVPKNKMTSEYNSKNCLSCVKQLWELQAGRDIPTINEDDYVKVKEFCCRANDIFR